MCLFVTPTKAISFEIWTLSSLWKCEVPNSSNLFSTGRALKQVRWTRTISTTQHPFNVHLLCSGIDDHVGIFPPGVRSSQSWDTENKGSNKLLARVVREKWALMFPRFWSSLCRGIREEPGSSIPSFINYNPWSWGNRCSNWSSVPQIYLLVNRLE